jgi:hypothetical protein
MSKRILLNLLLIVLVNCGLQAATIAVPRSAGGGELARSQLVAPADLTAIELDYYKKATDPEVKRNFIITRSYVRIAQKVVAKKISPEEFPVAKPAGFSVQYLLPDDAHVINEALGLALAKSLQKCIDVKAPGCR